MKTPKFIQFLIYLSVNCAIIYFYKVVLNQPLRIVETLVILFFGSLFSFCLCSTIRSPKQFVKALGERLIRPFALLLIVFVRVIRLCISVFIRLIKLLVASVAIIIYGLSPIDLIPDVIFGFGWIDDAAVTILLLYWGLTLGRIAMSVQLKEFTRELNLATKIKTEFP